MSNRMEGSAGPAARANGPISAPSTPASSIGPPLSPEELNEEPQSSLADVTQMWIKFGKTFAIIFPIYVLGYFEFSFSWVLIGLAMLFYWRKNYGGKDYRINRALAFLDHEEKVGKQSVPTTELPPWVSPPALLLHSWWCYHRLVIIALYLDSSFLPPLGVLPASVKYKMSTLTVCLPKCLIVIT